MAEKPWQELTRLVYEWQSGSGSEKEEAWNLIADFTVEHWIDIAGALEYAALHPQAHD